MVAAGPALFELSGVGFSAGGREILKGLDLTLEAGRIVGVIGPNGSGKSTLVKLLARQEAPSAGRIRFLGREIGAGSARGFARRLAYLPQFMPPAEGMNVEEFVALGRFPWHGTFGRFTGQDRAKVEEAIEQTDLRPFRSRLVDSLSGGERQRVWLAMLLAQDARCLVLDEPTSALDISHQAEMLELVRDLARARDLSVVVILHDINMAARICDRLIALGGGQVVADGPPGAIMNPQTLERIYGIGMGIFTHPLSGAPVGYVR
ncbi:ABC transporter ATP-binding protein [Aureimonas populi]|uniref:ABC transporter ATP-binding protein n=1 Tax=Aureimonas populi TaxID=1701758 RepID=A0ABW5CKT0_9HYPH|nr:ATP-binding cassette domain-containing protein [Aureimonas populi]